MYGRADSHPYVNSLQVLGQVKVNPHVPQQKVGVLTARSLSRRGYLNYAEMRLVHLV
jgi:hypothetical protein